MNLQHHSNRLLIAMALLVSSILLPSFSVWAQGEAHGTICHPTGYCAVVPGGTRWIGGYDREKNRLAIQTDTPDLLLLAINVAYFQRAGIMTSAELRFIRIDLNIKHTGHDPVGTPDLVVIAGFEGVRQNFQSRSDTGVLMLLTGGQDIEIIIAGRTNGAWTEEKEQQLLMFANSLTIPATLPLSRLSDGTSGLPSAPVYTPIPSGRPPMTATNPPQSPDLSPPIARGDPTFTQFFSNGMTARWPTPEQFARVRSVWRGINNYVDPRSPSIQVYYHTIPSESQTFSFRFCVDTKDEVQRIFGLVRVKLVVNGEFVSDSAILVTDSTNGLCRRWVTLLQEWSVGESVILEIHYTYTQDLIFNDRSRYRAGDYIQRIEAIIIR